MVGNIILEADMPRDMYWYHLLVKNNHYNVTVHHSKEIFNHILKTQHFEEIKKTQLRFLRK